MRYNFEILTYFWVLFRVVMVELNMRDFDPTLHMLHECIAEAKGGKAADKYTEERLLELYKFFETTTTWYAQVRRWPTPAILKFVKAGDKVLKLLGIGGSHGGDA